MAFSSSYFNQINYRGQPIIGLPDHRTGLAPSLTDKYPQSTDPLTESMGTVSQNTSGLPDMMPFTRTNEKVLLDGIIQKTEVPLAFERPNLPIARPQKAFMESNYDIDASQNVYYDGTPLGAPLENPAGRVYKDMLMEAQRLKSLGEEEKALGVAQEAIDYLQLNDPGLAEQLLPPDRQVVQPIVPEVQRPEVQQAFVAVESFIPEPVPEPQATLKVGKRIPANKPVVFVRTAKSQVEPSGEDMAVEEQGRAVVVEKKSRNS